MAEQCRASFIVHRRAETRRVLTDPREMGKPGKNEAEPRRLRLITLHDASLGHMHAAAQKVKFCVVRPRPGR
jgi:hypothetical protein